MRYLPQHYDASATAGCGDSRYASSAVWHATVDPRSMTEKLEEPARADRRHRCAASEAASARARIAARAAGQAKNGAAVYRPEREAQVLRRVAQDESRVRSRTCCCSASSREIMSACRALEDPITVAYLGPEGTFSQEAALKHFGATVAAQPCGSIDEVFRRVETGRRRLRRRAGRELHRGRGRPHARSAARDAAARVCGEVMLPIRQCLMSKVQGTAAHPQGVLAHPEPCAMPAVACPPSAACRAGAGRQQCRSGAARAAETGRGRDREQDRSRPLWPRDCSRATSKTSRTTRRASWCWAAHDAGPSGNDKTSLVLSARNVPGAMHALLTPLGDKRRQHDRLESRPARTGCGNTSSTSISRATRGPRTLRSGALSELETHSPATASRISVPYPAALEITHHMTDRRDLAPAHIRAIAPYQPGKPISELAREMGARGGEHREARVERESARREPAAQACDRARALADARALSRRQRLRAEAGAGEALRRRPTASCSAMAPTTCSSSPRALSSRREDEAVYLAARVRGVSARDAGASGARASKCRRAITATTSTRWRAAITRDTRIVFIANPNNPTGNVRRARAARIVHRADAAAACSWCSTRPTTNICRAEVSVDTLAVARADIRTSSSRALSPKRTAWPACASATRSRSPTSRTS